MKSKTVRELVYSNPWFTVSKIIQKKIEPMEYFVLSRSPGVICLIFDTNGDIILVKQNRIALSRDTIEMPAGSIEENETIINAVKREVLEETGYFCKSYYLLTKARLMINREDVIENFFVGFNARPMNNYKKTEDTKVVKFTKEKFKNYIVSGKFDQTVALGSLFEAEQKYNFKIFEDDVIEIEKKIIKSEKENFNSSVL